MGEVLQFLQTSQQFPEELRPSMKYCNYGS